VMMNFEQIIEKIMAGTGMSRAEVEAEIRAVQEEFHGFVTDAGAASLAAHRLGIVLNAEVRDLGTIAGEASPIQQEIKDVESCSTSLTEKQTGGSGMGLKYKVEAPKQIADGLHEGTIVRLEESPREKRGRKFIYLDVYILEKKEGVELRAGYPANITPVSALGKLCQRFGSGLDIGKEIEVEAILLNKPCTFVTVNEETKSGTFARVQRDSLKPMP